MLIVTIEEAVAMRGASRDCRGEEWGDGGCGSNPDPLLRGVKSVSNSLSSHRSEVFHPVESLYRGKYGDEGRGFIKHK